MIDTVRFSLGIDTGNSGVVDGNPLNNVADLLQTQLVDRLRAGADYGNIRDINGNTIGSWWIELDNEYGD